MPFSTSELLAHAQFAEFDAADLAFRVGETAALLNARCSDRVDADMADRLNDRQLRRAQPCMSSPEMWLSVIGFLGAGVIMREEGNVRGIKTAATLGGRPPWVRPQVPTRYSRRPWVVSSCWQRTRCCGPSSTRSTANRWTSLRGGHQYRLRHRGPDAAQGGPRPARRGICSAATYPTRDLEVHAFGEDEVEIEATLAATSVDGGELDAVGSATGRPADGEAGVLEPEHVGVGGALEQPVPTPVPKCFGRHATAGGRFRQLFFPNHGAK